MILRLIPGILLVCVFIVSPAFALHFVAGGDSRDDMTDFGRVVAAEAAENPALSLHDGDCWGGNTSTQWVNVIKGNSVMNALLIANNFLVSRGNHESFSALAAVSPTVVRNNSETYSFTMQNCFFVSAGYDNASYIQTQMATTAAKAARWRFVFQHINVYSTGSHAANGYAAVETACDSGHVTMLINGHDHTYERTKLMHGRAVVSTPSNVYNLSQTPGTIYMTNGLGGAPIYTIQTGASWAAVQYNTTYAYSVIDAGTDTCYVTTKNVSGTVLDQFKFVQTPVTGTLPHGAANSENKAIGVRALENRSLAISGPIGSFYSVTDLSGKVMQRGRLSAEEVLLNLSSMREGIYVAKINNFSQKVNLK
jgi:hypothetical protein